jgi:hypothetical protein
LSDERRARFNTLQLAATLHRTDMGGALNPASVSREQSAVGSRRHTTYGETR